MAGIQDALYRYGGMWGAAYRNGQRLADVVEVSGNIEINRIEVPLVGTTKQGYKAGRESREGTIRIQKIDAYWEKELHEWMLSRSEEDPATRRRSRATAHVFDLSLKIDDPEAHDYEEWNLYGCQIWRIPLGFSITDDIIDREFPLTWEREACSHSPATTLENRGVNLPSSG